MLGEVVKEWGNNCYSVQCFEDGRERLCRISDPKYWLENGWKIPYWCTVGEVVQVSRKRDEPYKYCIIRKLWLGEVLKLRIDGTIPLIPRKAQTIKDHKKYKRRI